MNDTPNKNSVGQNPLGPLRPLQSIKSVLPLTYLIVALFALRWTIVEPYVVPTGSMEPTLKTGDRLYAFKSAYDVRFPFTDLVLFRTGKVNRGDIILFKNPEDESITFVKRAVGIPGDRLEVKNGTLYINGDEMPKKVFPETDIMYDIERADNKTLYEENLTGREHYVILDHLSPNMRDFPETTIPPEHFFAMGDNRDNSKDSRYFGPVPFDHLKGKALFIWFSHPVDHPGEYTGMAAVLRWIQKLVSFWDWHIRFERIGTVLR
jgi:signal peptidase I